MNSNFEVDDYSVITFDGSAFVPRLLRLTDPSTPLVLTVDEGSSQICASCRNIYTPSDMHFIEPNTPYYFPSPNKIYGCEAVACMKRSARHVHGKITSQSKGSNSNNAFSSSSSENDNVPKEFIIVVGSSDSA
jgi:hypothetical protein